ncbi:glycine-rich cell wall structural protein-like [Abrus precatorius]|uniref:Glycine-rich cell wall structural protein-like n=1 Tax=Abrus precatorius TaxID=3816 RepID=A0A8B8M217_ABRPR|nr:glycine-rich cell wall structural protein-like [Abrus precatorius]
MGSKALLVLVMLLASVLVLYAEAAPKDVDEKFYKNDGDIDTNGVDDMKYGHGGWHGGGRRGWGGRGGGWGGRGGGWGWGHGWGRGWGYCYYGCCGWNYYGRCVSCCYYPGEHVDAQTHAQPQN